MSYPSTIQSPDRSDASYDEPSFSALATDSIHESNALSVESYADRLMDELFEDVERILETGVQLPIEDTPTPPQPLAASLAIARRDPAALPIDSPPVADPLPLFPPEPAAGELAKPEAEVGPIAVPAPPPPVIGPILERFLLIIATASLATTAVLWFLFYDRMQSPMAPTAMNPAGAVRGGSPADTEFLSYMERSLAAIERRAAARQRLEESLPPVTTASQPAPHPATVAAAPSQVLERVYVPVYQPPQVFGTSAVSPPAIVPPSVAPDVARLPSITVPTRPPVLPSMTVPPTVPASPGEVPNIAPPTTLHVLVGVLELGDRSAALFEISGTTQRIYVGESIGSSGWTLVSIRNQEAIVRRNGEVRSIYVGQRF